MVRFLIPLFLLSLIGCFEYEETILFRKSSSGTVEISYIVPLKKESMDSLIKFLPSDKTSIESKIKSKTNNILQLRDFTFRELEKSENADPFFKRKAKISYKIDFEDPGLLDGVLLGTLNIKTKGKSLNVKRDFPNLTDTVVQNVSAGEKKIITETLRLLKEGKIQFRVLFPKDSECSSNRGFVGLGNVLYTFPLQDTIENQDARSWEYKIRFY